MARQLYLLAILGITASLAACSQSSHQQDNSAAASSGPGTTPTSSQPVASAAASPGKAGASLAASSLHPAAGDASHPAAVIGPASSPVPSAGQPARAQNRPPSNSIQPAAAIALSPLGNSPPVPAAVRSPLPASPKTASPPPPPASGPMALVTKSGVSMMYVPGGQFLMGSSQGNPDEAPPHRVTVSAFLMDRVPVTHEMFTKVQLPDPSHFQENPRQPVESVRWRDAKEYCNERSRLEGLTPCYNEKTSEWDCNYAANGYRLPTEAEWEYAARGNAAAAYDFSDEGQLGQYAWFAENSDQKTHPVGEKRPNSWGLYDMYGNVSVWCEDVYDPGYYKSSPAVDPHGPPSPGKDVKRVLRGGNWKASASMCRATFRQGERTGDTDACFATDYCGLRCVRRAMPADLAMLHPPGASG